MRAIQQFGTDKKSWNGVAILSKNPDIKELRRVLPGDPEDMHSRYIEAIVNKTVIGCLYLPNGNPYPGPKFDYKLNWFKRFSAHAKKNACQGCARYTCWRLQCNAY